MHMGSNDQHSLDGHLLYLLFIASFKNHCLFQEFLEESLISLSSSRVYPLPSPLLLPLLFLVLLLFSLSIVYLLTLSPCSDCAIFGFFPFSLHFFLSRLHSGVREFLHLIYPRFTALRTRLLYLNLSIFLFSL